MKSNLLKRRQLPTHKTISAVKFDINELQLAFLKIANGERRESLGYEMLKQNYGEINSLTESFNFDKYHQIDLTEFDECKSSNRFRIRNRKNGYTSNDPRLNEKCYGKRNALCDSFWSFVLDSFQSPVTRARFAIMAPHSKIAAHADYDTDFSIRIHIPIFTHTDVYFFVQPHDKSGIVQFQMPADGHAYFLNQGLIHWAENNSGVERVHLVLSVDGQSDLN